MSGCNVCKFEKDGYCTNLKVTINWDPERVGCPDWIRRAWEDAE